MTSSRWHLLSLVALTTLGCGSSGGGGDDPVSARCIAIETRPLAWSERSPLGFSADELLSTLGARQEGHFLRDGATSTALELELGRASSGSLSYQQREQPADGPQPGTPCSHVLSIPATLSFTTNDGAFAEAWSVELLAESAARASGHATFDLEALGGNYRVTAVNPAQYDELVGLLDISLDGNTWSGELSGQALGAGSSSARSFEIGSFE